MDLNRWPRGSRPRSLPSELIWYGGSDAIWTHNLVLARDAFSHWNTDPNGAGKESRTPNAYALGPKPSPYANSGIPAYKSTFIYVLMESTPKPPATFSLSSCHSGGTYRTRTYNPAVNSRMLYHWANVPNTRRVYNSFNPQLNVYINNLLFTPF